MRKVLDFMEKNVQWLAMGLGGVYLLWMVWSYVINPQVKVTGVDPQSALAPGAVDEYIAEHNAAKLDEAMKRERPAQFAAPDFSKMLVEITDPKPVPDLTVAWVNSTAVQFVPGPNIGPGIARVNPNAVPVVQLPKLPPAMDLKSSSGR